MQLAAGTRCFRFQFVEQPQNLGLMCTPVEHVTQDHQPAVAEGPVHLRIDDLVLPEQLGQDLVFAVRIGDKKQRHVGRGLILVAGHPLDRPQRYFEARHRANRCDRHAAARGDRFGDGL